MSVPSMSVRDLISCRRRFSYLLPAWQPTLPRAAALPRHDLT
jgi:hypothetical protein